MLMWQYILLNGSKQFRDPVSSIYPVDYLDIPYAVQMQTPES